MHQGHEITIAPAKDRVVVRWRSRVIADSRRALELREATYPPVLYVPREDADMTLFVRTAHRTVCPYKGDANYFSLREGESDDVDAVWTYEEPKPGVAAIKDHIAFYPDRVQITREPE